ncbi:MAG TPA: hypothetical protein VFZ83_04300 [Acidimicrobiia bacterium]|nr:hypothetical protein [Acidimicrobiia bacterium]
MTARPEDRPGAATAREGGFATVGYITAASLALIVFTFGAQLLLGTYARSVVRAAAAEGVRSAVRVDVDDAAEICRARASAVVADALRGTMGETVSVTCHERDGEVVAVVTARVAGWGLVPSSTATGRARATREG